MSRETVLPVEIVRPNESWQRQLGTVLRAWLSLAVSAWVVMLLAPEIYKPVGYWHAFAFVLVIRTTIGDTGYHLLWTRESKS